MDQSVAYEVMGESGHGKPFGFGGYWSREEAEAQLAYHTQRVADAGREQKFWIREIDQTGLFRIPPKPTPRKRYTQTVEPVESRPGYWNTAHNTIWDGDRKVGEYDRNYPSYHPFEPFRQGDRNFALISPDYTATSVMDLDSGEIIASEERSAWGFCPVGFYVPDWWDVNDGSIIPGTSYWGADEESINGTFGFVWGCVWGDDNGWKVQYLDLSGVANGIIGRDERFGYLEIANHSKNPSEFIHIDDRRVTFTTYRSFHLDGRSWD